MSKRFRLIPPFTGDFLTGERLDGTTLDGGTSRYCIRVSELTEEEAREYVELCKWQFLRDWKIKQNNK